MGRYRLRRGLGVCPFADCTIVLDVAADRYWRLSAGCGDYLQKLGDDELNVDEPGFVRLLQLGFIVPMAHADDQELDLPAMVVNAGQRNPPSSSALESSPAAIPNDWHAVLAGLALPMLSRLELRTLPLARVLAGIRLRKRVPMASAPSLADLALRFDRVRRLAPVKPRCLPDSIAFLRYTARYGYAPRLVFGVTAHPFAAHCWVQDDACVLNDALDHALQFFPILIV